MGVAARRAALRAKRDALQYRVVRCPASGYAFRIRRFGPMELAEQVGIAQLPGLVGAAMALENGALAEQERRNLIRGKSEEEIERWKGRVRNENVQRMLSLLEGDDGQRLMRNLVEQIPQRIATAIVAVRDIDDENGEWLPCQITPHFEESQAFEARVRDDEDYDGPEVIWLQAIPPTDIALLQQAIDSHCDPSAEEVAALLAPFRGGP